MADHQYLHEHQGECFPIKGRFSARKAFSYKVTSAGESAKPLFPPSPIITHRTVSRAHVTAPPAAWTSQFSWITSNVPLRVIHVHKQPFTWETEYFERQMSFSQLKKVYLATSEVTHHLLKLVNIPMLWFQTAQKNKSSMKVNEH